MEAFIKQLFPDFMAGQKENNRVTGVSFRDSSDV